MSECRFSNCCANFGSWKCPICWRTVKEYGHFVAFKDKVWYEKRLPYIQLGPLFENSQRCEFYGGATK